MSEEDHTIPRLMERCLNQAERFRRNNMTISLNPSSMRIIDAQIDREYEKIAALEARKNFLASLPEDDFDNGHIISFRHSFSGQYSSDPYIYAAIKCNGVWYTTGPKSPKAYTWEQLVTWLGDDVSSIEWATEFESIV